MTSPTREPASMNKSKVSGKVIGRSWDTAAMSSANARCMVRGMQLNGLQALGKGLMMKANARPEKGQPRLTPRPREM
eukprot:5318282-Pyramimonas_sp.AAC.1